MFLLYAELFALYKDEWGISLTEFVDYFLYFSDCFVSWARLLYFNIDCIVN